MMIRPLLPPWTRPGRYGPPVTIDVGMRNGGRDNGVMMMRIGVETAVNDMAVDR